MKKKYISPDMTVVEMKTQQFLCGSIEESGTNLNVNISGGGSGDFGEDNEIN